MGHGPGILLYLSRREGVIVRSGLQREKSSRSSGHAPGSLFKRDSSAMFDDFRDAMIMRESADYGLVSSVEGAEDVLERAEEFLKKAKAVLREQSVPRKRRLRSE